MKFIVVFGIVLLAFNVKGQEVTDPKELFTEGQYFYVREDYSEALYFFKKLQATNKENAHFNFKVGECYLNIPGQEFKAVPYFEVAAQKTVPKKDFNTRDFNELYAPLHAYFYLGNAYRMAGDLESALKAYQKFIDSPYFYGHYNYNVVETEIKSCERAKIIQDSPIDMNKELVQDPISTGFSEYNPVLSHSANKIAFVRGLKFYEAVFVAEFIDGQWTKAVNISPEIGSDGDYYPTGMNMDGTVMLLARNFDGNSDIYYSEFDGVKWSKAQKLPGKINSLANESFASFGETDDIIYLVSDRQKGRGGKDIWKVQKDKEGNWSRPKNLGKEINSKLDEDTPMLCRKNRTLFFSSKAHYNMGGFDIFYSNLEGNDWTVPRNIGYPLNTTRDDLFYTVSPECSWGYYSIIDKDSGLSDIFKIEVNSVLAIPEQ